MDKVEAKKLKAEITVLKGRVKALSLEVKNLDQGAKRFAQGSERISDYGITGRIAELNEYLDAICQGYFISETDRYVNPIDMLNELRKSVSCRMGSCVEMGEILEQFEYSVITDTLANEIKYGRELKVLRHQAQEGQQNEA